MKLVSILLGLAVVALVAIVVLSGARPEDPAGGSPELEMPDDPQSILEAMRVSIGEASFEEAFEAARSELPRFETRYGSDSREVADLLDRLAEVPNIVGIKESSGDMILTAEFIRRTRDRDFKVVAGRDILILGTLTYGGAGAVASSANIVPKLVVEIYNKFMAGDLAGALEAQYLLVPMRKAYNLGSFPAVTKDYMRLLGFDVGESIRPNTRSSPEGMVQLKKLLNDLGAERLA